MDMLLMAIPFIGIFYFLMIRPEQKRKKKAAEMLQSLQIGDEITCRDGLVGKIVRITDEHITFETGEDRVRIKICRWAVAAKGKSTEEVPPQQDQPKP